MTLRAPDMNPGTEPVVSFTEVDRAFAAPNAAGDPDYAIRGLSFEQEAGAFYCLLGKSGCGKTTILNLVAGFLQPTAGRLCVGGRPVEKPGPDRAVVFQDYALLPWLSVRDNVELGLKVQGQPAPERRARSQHYLELVGLAHAEDKYPHQLSGGMQQRVSIARALALEPLILLMDEPFAGLDAFTRLAMQDELSRIWAETKKTVLFVTHSVDEAIYLGTRVLVIGGHPGRLVGDIPIALDRPRDRTSPELNDLKRDVLQALEGERPGDSRRDESARNRRELDA